MASKNDITGDAIRSKMLSKEGEANWDRIFGNRKTECPICGKILEDVTECAWSSCPKLERIE